MYELLEIQNYFKKLKHFKVLNLKLTNKKMVTKKRSRYEVSEKEKMINELDKSLHTKGANIGKSNFHLVAQLHPEYSRKMLIEWYTKKDAILNSQHKHKRFK